MKSIEANSILSFRNSIGLWHDHFGDLHYDGLIHLSRYNRVRGLPFFTYTKKVCKACLGARQCKEQFPKVSHYCATETLELVHLDFVGPLKTPFVSGSQYFVVFIDDYSCNS